MLKPTSILVPIDFNEKSMDVALNYAIALAQKFNLEINLLHVVEESGFFSLLFAQHDNEKVIKQIEDKLKQIAFDLSEKTKLRITPIIARGRVAAKINEIAEMLDISFIIIAASDDKDNKYAVGNNTYKLIHVSNRPILVIRDSSYPMEFKNILIPIDLVPVSREIVADIVDLAKINSAKITLIGGVWDDFENKELENKMTFVLNQVKNYVEANGLECKTVFWNSLSSEKEFQQKTCEYSRSSKIDVIIGTGKDASSPDYYISSNTFHFITCSGTPVLSVTPKEEGIISATGRI